MTVLNTFDNSSSCCVCGVPSTCAPPAHYPHYHNHVILFLIFLLLLSSHICLLIKCIYLFSVQKYLSLSELYLLGPNIHTLMTELLSRIFPLILSAEVISDPGSEVLLNLVFLFFFLVSLSRSYSLCPTFIAHVPPWVLQSRPESLCHVLSPPILPLISCPALSFPVLPRVSRP